MDTITSVVDSVATAVAGDAAHELHHRAAEEVRQFSQRTGDNCFHRTTGVETRWSRHPGGHWEREVSPVTQAVTVLVDPDTDAAHQRVADLIEHLSYAVDRAPGDDARHYPCLRDDLGDLAYDVRTVRNAVTARVVTTLLGHAGP